MREEEGRDVLPVCPPSTALMLVLVLGWLALVVADMLLVAVILPRSEPLPADTIKAGFGIPTIMTASSSLLASSSMLQRSLTGSGRELVCRCEMRIDPDAAGVCGTLASLSDILRFLGFFLAASLVLSADAGLGRALCSGTSISSKSLSEVLAVFAELDFAVAWR